MFAPNQNRMQDVRVWEEDVTIPTYETGHPEKNPMFLEKRVYQGSSGVVYPHPVIEKISDEKKDQTYQALFLENQYLKIMILPQLGGRIQMAFDKVKNRHFIYYNQVIKPALVGLTGPWISGGIEFNWPQHHRPSTFEPVDYHITENPDGSKTVWVNEVERMFRTKGMAGFTLHPGKAYLEIKGRLYNRTPFAQTFLWWANPAVKVNDHYQSIFPPDVYAVFDHGKRDVSSFPIAKGTYYKVDYSPGTDISRYRNIPVPTSYMAIRSDYNFIGGYEHDTKAGLLHVANHHVSPGKKQWTWGHGAFGQAWDRNLTDEDGPYIELMTGMFTDNQPDFSWLQPYEEKVFVQYFMPYQEVGEVKNASREAVINVEHTGDSITIKLYVTAEYPNLSVIISAPGKTICEERHSLSPETPLTTTVDLRQRFSPTDIQVTVKNNDTGKELVSYRHAGEKPVSIPAAAQAAKRPAEVATTEQLYLTGLHLEQYRHATFMANEYYEEALNRDPTDIRNNNALGLWLLRKAKFKEAEAFFRKAIKTMTGRNPNPYDGEPYFNLGCALKSQEKYDEAFEAFYKSTWNDAWQHAGFLELARIACLKNNYEEAEELIHRSLVRNYESHSARHTKVFILRKLGKTEEALRIADESLALDPFNFGCLFERYLLLRIPDTGSEELLTELRKRSHDWVHNFLEYALDYAQAGLYEDADSLLAVHVADKKKVYPLVNYYRGWLAHKNENDIAALRFFQDGAAQEPHFVFPNRIEEVAILQTALTFNTNDARACYYLGNFWYDKRQYANAIGYWEQSASADPGFPTVYRNLSLAYYNKESEPAKALQAMQTAFSLDPTDARVLMELDQLRKRLNHDQADRLRLLNRYPSLVDSREDLLLEKATLFNQLGHFDQARTLIDNKTFHPWEGGEGKVVGQYLTCHLELAKEAMVGQQWRKTLDLLTRARTYPLNLGEGKLQGTQENDIDFLTGVALEELGQADQALDAWHRATTGIDTPVQAIFYNDPQPDKIFYQGLAWLRLGETERAREIFERLMTFGKMHLQDSISVDYFAVSLPDLLVFDADLDLRNHVHCLYLMGLGAAGAGEAGREEASTLFRQVLALDVNHQGALGHLRMLDHPLFFRVSDPVN